MPYQCRYCGDTFCAEHRLPENHGCPGLQDWEDPTGVFDSGFDDGLDDPSGSSTSLADRLTGTGGPLSYFRGNLSYLFLGLMVITFFVQFALAPLAGLQPGSRLWRALFVLAGDNPEYVWTWVTSVFSHGGFGHIFGNGIVLFFFGPLVERRIGSRAFAALFLISGMAAGLGQVGFGLLIGDPVTGVLGASGAIMAIMGVLTVINPSLRVYLWFLVPVPIWVLTFGYAALSLVALSPATNVLANVAHFAHLLGLVGGLAYGRYVKDRISRVPGEFTLGPGGGGPGGPGGPGRGGGRGPF